MTDETKKPRVPRPLSAYKIPVLVEKRKQHLEAAAAINEELSRQRALLDGAQAK